MTYEIRRSIPSYPGEIVKSETLWRDPSLRLASLGRGRERFRATGDRLETPNGGGSLAAPDNPPAGRQDHANAPEEIANWITALFAVLNTLAARSNLL